jgi:secreted trypsin-like serine protease
LNSRIVGGQIAVPTRYPYFTYLTITTGVQQFNCGGSLIAPDIILSAGHCAVGLGSIQRIDVMVNYTSHDFTGYEHSRRAIKWLPHPNFDIDTLANDILLIKLRSPVNGVPILKVNTIPSRPIVGDLLTVMGFGYTNYETLEEPTNLMEVQVKAINQQICTNFSASMNYVADNSIICAGFKKGGKDACDGDSGGPLIIPKKPGYDIGVGIVSFGDKCALPDKPGGYTRISYFRSWIAKTMCDLNANTTLNCGNTTTKSPTAPPSTSIPTIKMRPTSKSLTMTPLHIPTIIKSSKLPSSQ